MVFYVGIEKTHPPDRHNPKRLYQAILREAVARLDRFCAARAALFMMVLDEQSEEDFRARIVAEASREMFGSGRDRMIEPPIEAESHLFQTLQCADWMCGLVGRFGSYAVAPDEFPDFAWAAKYFGQRLARVAPISSIRCEGARTSASSKESRPH